MLSNQKIASRFPRRSMLFLLISTLIVLLGGVATLLLQQQHRPLTQADSASVVGPPTLPAATVNSILAGTPMAGTGQVIEEASRNTNIDDAFALGVWWTETNDGAAGVGLSYRNPGGVRSSAGYAVGGGGYTIYPSYAAAIDDWFNIVESRYINRGLTSVYTICYPYVGTSGAASWANKVYNLMVRYHGMAPAPTPIPTPTPTPSPTPKPRDWQQEQPIVVVHPVSHIKQSAPVAAPAERPAPVIAAPPVLSARDQNIVVGIGLLGSIMLVGLGVMFRRRTQVSVSAGSAAALPTTTALAMDGINQLNGSVLYGDFSSASNHSVQFQSEFEPLEAALEPATAPLNTVSEPATAPILAISGGGLLTRYAASSRIGSDPLGSQPAPVQTEQLSSSTEEKSIISPAFDSSDEAGPITTGRFPSVRPGISLPVRRKEPVLELMATGKAPEEKRRGLLSRYADNSL
jgi:hypothetical protein